MAEKCTTASELALASRDLDAVVSCLHSWQTLVTGLFALLGAFMIYRQIRQADRLEQGRRERRLAAASSTSLFGSNLLRDYAHECRCFYEKIIKSVSSDGKITINIEEYDKIPRFPPESLVYFERIIENSPRSTVEEALTLCKIINNQQWKLTVLIKNLNIPNYWRDYSDYNYHFMRLFVDTVILEICLDKLDFYAENFGANKIEKIEWKNVRDRSGSYISPEYHDMVLDEIKIQEQMNKFIDRF